MDRRDDVEVALLIGADCTRAIMPREVIPGRDNEPYALRTSLGWGIIGNIVKNSYDAYDMDDGDTNHSRIISCQLVGDDRRRSHFSVRTLVKEIINPAQINAMFEMDFSEVYTREKELSRDERQFSKIMEDSICCLPDGHYEMPLPLRNEELRLPNNKPLALNRLRKLSQRFEKDQVYHNQYKTMMQEVIDKGFAEKADTIECCEGKTWFIPHHGVFHPKKPDKLRIVYDCSAKYKGESLNSNLLPGPDLTNNLIGVLMRFRMEQYAFMCDIEAMFHQFKVKSDYRDFLRFLWWEDGDITKHPSEYRMTVHLFGATSSPGCANFGLKRTAIDHKGAHGQAAAEFITNDFYVDDGLKSLPTEEEAIDLIHDTIAMCNSGGLRLHKFSSNSRRILETLPNEDRAKDLKDLDLNLNKLPIERALGVQWCVEHDQLQFKVILQDKPLTRRGILSTVSSLYDPLGFAAPLVLVGKQLLQELCRIKADWDDPIPEDVLMQWEKWKTDISSLGKLSIQRCYKPTDFGTVKVNELHHFSDASMKGYGQCSYLRQINVDDKVHCSFIMGKARVTPLKPITVPRLELTAALVSTKASTTVKRELASIPITSETFWTDSKVVLGYISNEARRFHAFVANRVQEIRDASSPEQWRYVSSKENPADIASRGLNCQDLTDSAWLNGPRFLWDTELPDQEPECIERTVSCEDPEVKRTQCLSTKSSDIQKDSILKQLERFSNWNKVKRVIALCLRFKDKLQQCLPLNQQTTVEELKTAENRVFKLVQHDAFPEGDKLKRTNALYRLDPFLDDQGILRVGGRIKRSQMSSQVKHPIILPRKCHLTNLIIRHFHQQAHHQGRGITLNALRSNGLWVIGGTSAVSSCILNCVTCRKLRGMSQKQKMADLPQDRLEEAPPFSYAAIDYFGPWIVKEGRREMKRYGVLFTCMACRAVHLESASTLDTSSFINALRRFLARRGPIRQLRSDRGTNFVGAKKELCDSIEKLDQGQVAHFLRNQNCDWFTFEMNSPSASHMGGVWERQIRTVRSVLNAILDERGHQLNDEALRTFLCEAEAIVNSRPLTTQNLSSPECPEPLTPNHLLTMKTDVLLPPPGDFQQYDVYATKRWRRVQFLANDFWRRWRKEYLQLLQERKKWNIPRRNIKVGDIVILRNEDVPRNKWKLARVHEVINDKDGLIRRVRITTAEHSSQGVRKSVLERPVQKVVLLLKIEEQNAQPGEP